MRVVLHASGVALSAVGLWRGTLCPAAASASLLSLSIGLWVTIAAVRLRARMQKYQGWREHAHGHAITARRATDYHTVSGY